MRLNLIILMIFCFNALLSQTIEIKVVNKESVPVSSAYILINKKVIEITDTLGIASIPENKLAINDTISVSYLGSSSLWTVFDKSLQETRKYFFKIDESGYTLSEVIVEYQDIEKLFNRSLKTIPQINYNCTMNANFHASFRDSRQNVRIITGKFEVENEIRSKEFYYRQKGWFHHPINFSTTSDTVNLSNILSNHTHYLLNSINRAIEFSRPNPPVIVKPQYTYLGEKDNYNVFRLVYPKTISLTYPFQILVIVDKEKKEIHSIELSIISGSFQDKYYNQFNIKFDCLKYNHNKPKMNTVYIPVNVKYSSVLNSGFQIEILISDPTLKI